ncbi:MAG: SLC13/DASS family transporter [Bacteroidales bacterium]|nr:SLC13/DASS family transporter [Bacteroidales bacterium]
MNENSVKHFLWKPGGFFSGILVFLFVLLFFDLEPGKPAVTATLAVALLMAVWWITEVIPLAVTSLIPVVLFPLLGIMNGKTVSSSYFNHVIFLFIGGFILALAIQKWNLHRRIALKILMITGTSPLRILFGFMFATAFLSMWISNTATAMMMIPIVISIISKLEEYVDDGELKKYSTGLLLGVAYSASIGGIATLVGTPPNLSFARIFQIMFPQAPEISFSSWFVFALPLSIVIFIIVWFYLYLLYKPENSWKNSINSVSFKKQYKDLGAAGLEEKIVFVDFIVMALLWLTRSDISIGTLNIPGWSRIFSHPEYLNDGTVAIAMAVLLFMIPSRKGQGRIMTWPDTKLLPWNIVLLFGGGFALASGFKESGLSLWFGEQLSGLGTLHPILILLIISLGVTFLTELTSNTATTEMLLPILAGLAVTLKVNPLLFLIPATISASMAFMLPVATPPNAIVFGTNRITMVQMAKTGLILNLIGAAIIALYTYYIAPVVFHLSGQELPFWVH